MPKLGTFGLRERELQRLREVEYALSKIDSGTYGICEEYDEPIEKSANQTRGVVIAA